MLHFTAVLYYSTVLSFRISPFWRYSVSRMSGLGRSERSDILWFRRRSVGNQEAQWKIWSTNQIVCAWRARVWNLKPSDEDGTTVSAQDFTAKIASSTTHELGTATPYISRLKAYKLRTPFCQLRSSGSYQITPNLFFSDLRLRQIYALGVRWSRCRRVTSGEVGKLFSTNLREMMSLVSQYAPKR